jgi:predicted phage tail protein
MKTIVLNGELGKIYGKRHKLDVKTAAEAVRALIANFPSIEKYFLNNDHVVYRVRVNNQLIDSGELSDPAGGKSITITPMIRGAGGDLGKIVIGALLIAAAVFNPLAFYGGSALLTGAAATIAIGVGTSLIVGGVSGLLAPKPKTIEPPNGPNEKPSYAFNGPVNTTVQGNPVPIGYGRMIVGSAVISAGITT